jgi:hypothetical protein
MQENYRHKVLTNSSSSSFLVGLEPVHSNDAFHLFLGLAGDILVQSNAKYFSRQCHFLTNFEILNCKSILTFTLFI